MLLHSSINYLDGDTLFLLSIYFPNDHPDTAFFSFIAEDINIIL